MGKFYPYSLAAVGAAFMAPGGPDQSSPLPSLSGSVEKTGLGKSPTASRLHFELRLSFSKRLEGDKNETTIVVPIRRWR
jgi:hypothetical protein